MRNMKTICAIRDVFRAMTNFEASFEQVYQITLNEAMILCALKCSSERMTATNLSKQTDLSPSHTSMYFTLSAAGRERVCDMEIQKVEIPELLKPLFKDAES